MKTIQIADLFCGAGGASTAARRASKSLNLKTELLAVNHWPVAIETHSLNHPEVRHMCASIDQVNPREAVPGGRLQLLIAAPECTYFSTARGGRPVTDQQRTQPYVILKWLQELYVENLLIENVPEFQAWGPIGANGKPLKKQRGNLFEGFLEMIRKMDYRVEYRILNAADYGDPTTRRRLFIIAKRGRKAVHWPMPTHSKTGSASLFGPTKKWRAAREVIDWSLKGKSIFGRKKPLSPKTMARIIAGLDRFGGEELKPFLVILRGTDAAQVANSARSIDEPVGTITASGTHHALAEPFLVPVTHAGGEGRVLDVNEPLPTITCAHRGELAVVEPIIVPNNHNNVAKSLDEPVPTVTGGGRLMMVDAAFVLQQQSGGVPRPVDEPLPTIATDGAQMLVEPFVVTMEHQGSTRSLDAPLPTITTAKGGAFALIEPFIAALAHGDGGGRGNSGRVRSVDEPIGAIHAGGNNFAVVQPFIVPPRGFSLGAKVDSVEDPLRTIVAASGHNFAVVEPIIASYYGTQNVSPVSDPLPTVTTKDRFALVMPVVNGRALDIRLRMLKPHELAAAMSFGDDYQFAGNQGDQVKQIGNAWPCRLGQALIQTILEEYAAKRSKPTRLEAIA